MPPVRLSSRNRRRSSLAAISFAKPGYYSSPKPVTFAPNITPRTYVEPDYSIHLNISPSPTSTLFPPSDTPIQSRRRVPPGKRRSLGYIPRPPNAFMLFRADFVRQKHVPGSIETNHGSLSKIIGNCWKSLPLDEKRVWEVKAKHAKAEHKARYPEYRFRPVHNKNKEKKKDKPAPSVEDERRCEQVAQLLLEGKKGDELAAAVRYLDRNRPDDERINYHQRHPNPHPSHPVLGHRRSSSVPLPNPLMAMPTLPFLNLSRPVSPVGNISRSTRIVIGQRRASSACPTLTRAWTLPDTLHRDHSPLPEPDTSLFEQSFLDSNFSFPSSYDSSFNLHDVLTSLPPNASTHDMSPLGPLDNIPPHHQAPPYIPSPLESTPELDLDPRAWIPLTTGYPSPINSSSPDTPQSTLPVVVAPQPMHHQAQVQPRFSVMWKEFTRFEESQAQEQQHPSVFDFDDQQPIVANEHDLLGLGFGNDISFQNSDLVPFNQQQQQQQEQQQQQPVVDFAMMDGNIVQQDLDFGRDRAMSFGFGFEFGVQAQEC